MSEDLPITERIPMHELAPHAEEYSIIPEEGGYAVVHAGHDGSVGCIRWAESIEEAQDIIAELKKSKA